MFLLVFVALIIAYKVTSPASTTLSTEPVADGIRCDTGEQLAVHYHAHLEILHQGTPVTVPAQTGIPGGTCFYWMHTHDTSGIIHIEAPRESASRQFTLGDFFKVWRQPLSRSQVATLSVGSGEQMKVWVNGDAYDGDPSKIVLKSHSQVVIEIGPPFTDPPPTFTWDPNNYPQ